MIDDTVSRMSQLSVLAQSLASAPDEDARLALAMQAAMTIVDHCDHAGITNSEAWPGHPSKQRRGGAARQPPADRARGRAVPRCRAYSGDAGHSRPRAGASLVDVGPAGARRLYTVRGKHFDADDVATGQALSSYTNRKLVDVAAEIASTRTLPELR